MKEKLVSCATLNPTINEGEIGLLALPVNVRSAAGQSQLQHPIICNNKIGKAVADDIIHLLTQ